MVRFPDEANSARNTSGSSEYAMTRSRKPWRHPGSVSQLRTGTRIWNAEASSSRASAAPPSRGGAGLRGIAAAGTGPAWLAPAAAAPSVSTGAAGTGSPGSAAAGLAGPGGSNRITGPCGEARASSTGSRSSSLVTALPRWNVPARPRPSNIHPFGPKASRACCRDTVGSLTTTSLSVLRPILTTWSCSKLYRWPSQLT